MHTEGHPPPTQEPIDECPPKDPVKKQVRFNMDEDLGENPTLPMDLTTFLKEGTAKEQDNAPSPSVPLTVDPWQLPHNDGQQCHPTYMGGASPKVPVIPSATAWSGSKAWLRAAWPSGPPWLMDQGRDGQGRRSPCWWKEIRAIKKYTLESALKRYTIESDLSKPEALYFSQW